MYGDKIGENIVQGMARDLLVDAMFRIERRGLQVVHHCHDSLTVAVPIDAVEEAMAVLLAEWRHVPAWAQGLILDAEVRSGVSLADA